MTCFSIVFLIILDVNLVDIDCVAEVGELTPLFEPWVDSLIPVFEISWAYVKDLLRVIRVGKPISLFESWVDSSIFEIPEICLEDLVRVTRINGLIECWVDSSVTIFKVCGGNLADLDRVTRDGKIAEFGSGVNTSYNHDSSNVLVQKKKYLSPIYLVFLCFTSCSTPKDSLTLLLDFEFFVGFSRW